MNQQVKLHSILLRPNIGLETLIDLLPDVKSGLASFDLETIRLAETGLKYAGYIQKEQEMVEKLNRLESVHLHSDFDYRSITALSAEAREKLSSIKPRTIGQASRISGVSPSDVSVLLVSVGR